MLIREKQEYANKLKVKCQDLNKTTELRVIRSQPCRCPHSMDREAKDNKRAFIGMKNSSKRGRIGEKVDLKKWEREKYMKLFKE